jgi:two-component system NtrC family sensor kinase
MRDMGNDYKGAVSRLVAAAANPSRISALERRALELGRELITMTQGMAFTANLRLQQKTQDALAALGTVRTILFGTLLIGTMLAVLAASLLAKGLERRLRKLLEATRRISRGELERGVELADAPGSEFRELGDAFNTMIRNLHLSQRHLVQSAKLTAIGEWATNIAYEVNNPLTGVLGHAGLLEKADDIPEDRKEQLKIIERETLRARAILKNLLDFSRRKPPRPVMTDISGLVRDTIQSFQGQAGMSNVRIAADCAPGLPQTAVDAGEMKQVFVNLIRNAFFAMPKGGGLTISCRHARDYAGREVVAVEFADTGHGIPEEHLDKIFDPFFTTRPGGEGTGLGLSISFMVVQNHGGRIEVESRVGEGSTFRVILPV